MKKIPLPIMIFSGLMLVINVVAFFGFMFYLPATIPELGAISTGQELGFMLAGRQLGATVVLALALFSKNARLLQLAWLLALLREATDVAGSLVSGNYAGITGEAVFLAAEIATFIYLGRIASSRIAKYASEASHTGK